MSADQSPLPAERPRCLGRIRAPCYGVSLGPKESIPPRSFDLWQEASLHPDKDELRGGSPAHFGKFARDWHDQYQGIHRFFAVHSRCCHRFDPQADLRNLQRHQRGAFQSLAVHLTLRLSSVGVPPKWSQTWGLLGRLAASRWAFRGNLAQCTDTSYLC